MWSFIDDAWFADLTDDAHDSLGGEAGLSEEAEGDDVGIPPMMGVGIIGRLGEAPGEDCCGDSGSGGGGVEERPPPFIDCCIKQWILNQFERRP